ncbi:MAG: hypothetical protein HY656_03960 [Acidobacteria bacterium]|nr:hypothetical protein [Acidobacteriota bacterium]
MGRELPAAERSGLPSSGPADALVPTVGCERCESVAVYELETPLESATHVCGNCYALLTFTITDVVQN